MQPALKTFMTMSQLTIYSDSDFIKREERALRHFQVFSWVRSGNHGLNEYGLQNASDTGHRKKITQRPRCRSCWNMLCAWVQGQTSKTDCQNMSFGDPQLWVSQSCSRCIASPFCSQSPCTHSQCLTGACGTSPYTPSDVFQQGISRADCLSFLLTVDLRWDVHILNMVQWHQY